MSEWNQMSGIGLSLLFASIVLALLPQSPFQTFITNIDTSPILQHLAWAVPIGAILAFFQAWLAAVLAFYLVMMLARWIKLID